MTLESHIEDAVKASFPANGNRALPHGNVVPVTDARINAMVATLESLRPRQRTWERILLRT